MLRDFIPFMISMLTITTYLPITIAGIIAHIRKQKINLGIIICFIIHAVCLIAWHEIAVCLHKAILIAGTVSPLLIFFITYYFLKKAKFSRGEFKGKAIFKSLLKMILYFIIISPMIAASWIINLVSVDCGI